MNVFGFNLFTLHFNYKYKYIYTPNKNTQDMDFFLGTVSIYGICCFLSRSIVKDNLKIGQIFPLEKNMSFAIRKR
jgi:hypothetical protein